MASRLPTLNTCCFLFSLETGAKLVAFIELIGDAALFLYGLVSTLNLLKYNLDLSYQEAAYRDILLTVNVYVDLSLLFELIFAVYLLYGIYKNKQNYIKVWLVVQSVFLIISVVGIILMLAFHFFLDTDEFNILEEGVALLAHCYFLLVVYSYYCSIKRSNNLLSQV